MNCSIKNFSFAQTNAFSKLMLDYTSNSKDLQTFIQYPNSIDVIPQIIEDKNKENIDRKVLVEVLENQYQSLEQMKFVADNIRLLENENTFCIVTAHQLNIFGGPLYYIYKIAQTISTCNQLKVKYPEYNFVPIYWMGSEDHDFEEINHTYLYNKKIEWNDEQGGISGFYKTNSLQPILEELEILISNQTYGNELMTIFRNAYSQDNLASATRTWLHQVFGNYGLVIIDGNNVVFKQQCIEIIKDDLLNHTAFDLVQDTIVKIEELGYKHQAKPRAINLFYIEKNKRNRIEFDEQEQKYFVINSDKSFTKEEILKELEKSPELFSPNVILRPLFQQKVLPSIMYIGGGGEVAYWLQLKSVFQNFKVNFPQLIVRNSALLCNNNSMKRLEKLNLFIEDMFQSVDELKKDFIDKDNSISIIQERQSLEQTFAAIQEKIKAIDASLVNYVGAEAQKTFKSMENIEARINKSLKQKNEIHLNQIEKLKNQLFPNNSLQERVENFSSYYAEFGKDFINELINSFDVYQKQFLVIELDKKL